MLICKYTKLHPAHYASHLDTLRAVMATIRRANLKVEFSDGFNPHMRLFFSLPLPLGVESKAEFFAVDTNENAKDFMVRFNTVAPPGIKILSVKSGNKDKMYADIFSAEYKITFDGITYEQLYGYIAKVLQSKVYNITYAHKGISKTAEVREKILNLTVSNNKNPALIATLRHGNVNLSVLRLAEDVCKYVEKPLFYKAVKQRVVKYKI